MKRVAILQSNYIPWKGYFDLIGSVDEFVFYDEVQYTKQDWRNRNKIKTEDGVKWISVPVTINGLYKQKVSETRIATPGWGKEHWAKIEHAYRRARYFKEISEWLKPMYLESSFEYLAAANRSFISAINEYLEIGTKLICSTEYELSGDRNERLVRLCEQAGAACYVSGPAAKEYLDVSLFLASNIQVEWFGYAQYKEYPQLWGDFEHSVSVLDLLFNTGPDAVHYIGSR